MINNSFHFIFISIFFKSLFYQIKLNYLKIKNKIYILFETLSIKVFKIKYAKKIIINL
jgi:hypothetical protein